MVNVFLASVTWVHTVWVYQSVNLLSMSPWVVCNHSGVCLYYWMWAQIEKYVLHGISYLTCIFYFCWYFENHIYIYNWNFSKMRIFAYMCWNEKIEDCTWTSLKAKIFCCFFILPAVFMYCLHSSFFFLRRELYFILFYCFNPFESRVLSSSTLIPNRNDFWQRGTRAFFVVCSSSYLYVLCT